MINAATQLGTPPYMASEIFESGYQTYKIDVWSLFVTMIWLLDAGRFRQDSDKFKNILQIRQAVVSAASGSLVSRIKAMAIINPKERASAAQMLVEHYHGAELSTPRSQVPALTAGSSHTIAAVAAPFSGSYSRIRTRKPSAKRLPSNANRPAVARLGDLRHRQSNTFHRKRPNIIG
jgi:serine/threonine protein kinase